MPRVLVGEMMDDPALDRAAHSHALGGLAHLNSLSRSSSTLYSIVRREAMKLDRPLAIVDIATGSADVPVGLLKLARREGVHLEVTACDISPVALAAARDRAQAAGVLLAIRQLDILKEEPPEADVLTCSLFLHHLSDHHVRVVVTKMARAAREMVLISDLRRGLWGTTLAAIIPRLATTSKIVHVDALRSARAALSLGEVRAMTRGIAGGNGWRVRPAFPARMLISWERQPTTPW